MKVQCVGIVFSGLSVVFMFTWPAEHLIHIVSFASIAELGSVTVFKILNNLF